MQQRARELKLRALVRLRDVRGSRSKRNAVCEQLLVQTEPAVPAGDRELGRSRREHPVRRTVRLHGELCMVQRSAVVTAEPPHAGEHRVGGHVDVARAVRLGESLLLVRDRLVARHRVDLRAEPAKPDEGTRAVRAGRERLDELLQQRHDVLASFACRGVEIRRGQQPSRACALVGVGRQLRSALGKRGRGLGSATRVESSRSILELCGNGFTRRRGSVPEMQRTLVEVVEDVRKREMREPPLFCRVHLEQRRREERMSESPVCDLVDDAGSPQLVEHDTCFVPEDLRVEAAERGCQQAGAPGCIAETGESCAEGPGERLGHRAVEAVPGGELERVVRAAVGEIREPLQLRRRQRTAGPFEHELGEVSLRKSADLHPVGVGKIELDPNAHGTDERDRFTVEPAKGIGDGAQARAVDPLEIVDRDHDRGGNGEQAENAERREPDGGRIEACVCGLAATKGVLERGALRSWQRGERRLVDRGEEVAENGERELDLRLGRARGEHLEAARRGFVDGRNPDRRFADAGCAREDEPTAARRSVGEEAARLCDLSFPADHDEAILSAWDRLDHLPGLRLIP